MIPNRSGEQALGSFCIFGEKAPGGWRTPGRWRMAVVPAGAKRLEVRRLSAAFASTSSDASMQIHVTFAACFGAACRG